MERLQNGLGVAIAGAGLALAGEIAPHGWWTWGLVGLGLVGIVLGLPIQAIVVLRGRRERPAPSLDAKVLELVRMDRSVPAIGNRAGGRSLGIRFIDRSRRGIKSCRLRVEHLDCEPYPGWDPNLQRRPTFLWEAGQDVQDIPPGGQRTCWIATATLDLPDDPRGQLGSGWTIVRGNWRVGLVIEADGYQVRHEEVAFELRSPGPSDAPESLLQWRTG